MRALRCQGQGGCFKTPWSGAGQEALSCAGKSSGLGSEDPHVAPAVRSRLCGSGYVPHHVRTFMSGAFRYQLRGVSLRRDWSTGAATTRNPNDGQLVLVPKLAPHPGPGYGCHVHGVVRPS